MKILRISATLPLFLALGACHSDVLSPIGDIASQQKDMVLFSTVLMLLIIVPVMALTVLFAWRYRQSNTEAEYDPDWDHSTQLEFIVWAAPLLIIICLGALTWMGTHLLDPYRPIDRIAPGRAVAANQTPLEVDVVALDWKWLFIYPQYGVATVNDMAAPMDRQIDFHITASSVMNSFYIPALAGQIYAMPAMETRLHAVANKPGTFEGFSANYSGAGFSGMHFKFHSLDAAGFGKWIAAVKAQGGALTRAAYLDLEKPSENVAPRAYGQVDQDLYRRILNMCVAPGTMCMDRMIAIDNAGGEDAMHAGKGMPMPMPMDEHAAAPASGPLQTGAAMPVKAAPLQGAGLPNPHLLQTHLMAASRRSQS